jgi:hypothetical protein
MTNGFISYLVFYKAIQREEHKDGMELMSPIATNRQAVGRWFVIYVIICYESNLIIIIF